ncbi:MAG: tRNA (adenosine(37)-N6)-threonylcarbamoyltransferase complex ATPase subunit type 1 TsaE [Ilumatobacteraceae bacterium]
MLLLRSSSIDETHAIAAAIAGVTRPGDVIILSGEMGAGKTAFAQGFGRALGVDEPITSPTYTLVHSYDVPKSGPLGRVTLHHADLYRLDRTEEVADLALAELAEFDGIVLVEWGDVVETTFGEHLVVHLEYDDAVDDDEIDDESGGGGSGRDEAGSDVRSIEIAGVGPTWASRWSRVITAVEAYRC